MKRACLRLVLAFLLLFAQHSALSHQIGHIQDHRPGQSQKQNGGKQGLQSGLCVFHIAFGAILGTVGCAESPLRVASNGVECGIGLSPFVFPASLIIPASRGPPVLP